MASSFFFSFDSASDEVCSKPVAVLTVVNVPAPSALVLTCSVPLMLPLACRTTALPVSTASCSESVLTVLVVALEELEGVPLLIVISSGSSSQVPALPLGAPVLTRP